MKLSIQMLSAAFALVLASPAIAQTSGTGQVNSTTAGGITFGPDDAAEAAAAQANPLATFKYYFVPASAFTRRASSNVTTYVSGGCIQAKSDFAVSDIQIENGASIVGLRVYYKDTDASNSVTAYVTAYDGSGTTTDYGPVSSTAQAGYGSVYFGIDPNVVVNNSANSYVFNVMQSGPSATTAICGARLFYSIP